jgi:predicted nucleotidyltransferase
VNDKPLKALVQVLVDWAAGKTATVYLFGSRVRGDHRPDSDVDIAVGLEFADNETHQWWMQNHGNEFECLKSQLRTRLHIHDPDDDPEVLRWVKSGQVVYKKENVVCVRLAPRPTNDP